MILIRKATTVDVDGICRVCANGYRNTYKEIHPQAYVERIIQEFYQPERIKSELSPRPGWDGWFVALDEEEVVGAGAGGLTEEGVSELFVLYLNPARRGEGIGTKLLEVITQVQIEQGAAEQWVSVAENNWLGIPFYEARGFVKINRLLSYENQNGENHYSLRYRRKL